MVRSTGVGVGCRDLYEMFEEERFIRIYGFRNEY